MSKVTKSTSEEQVIGNEPIDRMRLDIFLHRIRFFKTRALSSTQISKKSARISRHGDTRRTDKPAALVFVGDIVSFNCNKEIVTLNVLALPIRRGPASEAQKCYRLYIDASDKQD